MELYKTKAESVGLFQYIRSMRENIMQPVLESLEFYNNIWGLET
jgi:hypothetical protein